MAPSTRALSLRRTVLSLGLSLVLLAASSPGAAQTAPGSSGVVKAPDGVEIAYTERGDGELSVVLVHCWACNSQFWREQVPVLAENYHVVTLDLPGHGNSGREREKWSLSAYALDVKTVVEALGLEKIVLVGHSMGGPIALASYAHLAAQTQGVIVVDSVHDAEMEFAPEAVEAWAKTLEADFEVTMRQMVTGMFAETGSPELRDWVIEEALKSDHKAMVELIRNYAELQVKQWLSATKVPVRAINAAPNPPVIPETKTETNQKYADFDVVLMEGVGHYLLLEKPEEFNELLMAKLEEISAAPAAGETGVNGSPD